MTAPLLDGYVTRDELAKMGDLSPRTIQRYEREPDGLPFVVFGGRRLYYIPAVREWIANRGRRLNPRRRS